MSQKALAHLSSAFTFQHYYAAELDKGADADMGKATIWADIRDAELKAAGLPDFEGIINAASAQYQQEREARTVQPRPSMASMVQAVREHALANYNKDGWDYLVECWEDSDIEDAIGNARTYAGAIKACRATVRLLDERRAEVLSEIW